MSFQVTILGSGSAVPTANRNCSSQYISCSSRFILIDCGEGTQMQFRKFGIKFRQLDHVLISHMHGDHYFGLVGLLSTMSLLGRTNPIHVYGPEGLEEIIKAQLNHDQSRLTFEMNFKVINPKSKGILFEDEKIVITHFPLKHKIPTSGFLIKEKEKERTLNVEAAQRDKVPMECYQQLKKSQNVTDENGNVILFEKYTEDPSPARSYAYCSDTKYTETIIEYIQDVNLLYHEATFTEDLIERAKATMHSTALQAATIAKKANVEKLLLGHLSARYDSIEENLREAQSVFENSIIVEDGDVYSV